MLSAVLDGINSTCSMYVKFDVLERIAQSTFNSFHSTSENNIVEIDSKVDIKHCFHSTFISFFRTNMGDRGRLQTSQLQRMTPNHGDVRFNVESIPSIVRVNEAFKLTCTIMNNS